VFWYRANGAADWTFYDVLGGSIEPAFTGLPSESLFMPAIVVLYCAPYGLRPAITTDSVSGTLTAFAQASQVYRAAVPGHVEALLTLQLADLSTGGKVINRVRIGRRHMQPMLSTDFQGIYSGVKRLWHYRKEVPSWISSDRP